MKKNRLIYALLLMVLFWLMVMYNGWRTQMIFEVALLLPVVTAMITHLAARRVKIYFDEKEEYCQKNDSIKKYIMVDNSSALAMPRIELKVEIRDYMGSVQKRTLLINAERWSVRNFAMDMTFNHYGIISITIRQIKVFDFFLLFPYKKKLDIHTLIYVFPEFTDELLFQVHHQNPYPDEDDTDAVSGARRGNNRSEVIEVDEYREGDDVRSIHWKLSSKSDGLIVKRFGETSDEKVHICVDSLMWADNRYGCCDKLLAVLHAVIRSCIENGIEYDITGYDGEQFFETDEKNILRRIGTRTDNSRAFELMVRERNMSGTNIYLTTGEVDEENLSPETSFLFVPAEKADETAKKTYYMQQKTLIQVEASKQEEKQQKDKLFVELYHDKIRKRKKIKYTTENFQYVVYQTIISFFASFLAVYSIYDVIYLYQGAMDVLLLLVLFVGLHFGLNIFGNGLVEEKKMAKIRNGIVFFGYFAILFLGGFRFVADGTKEIVGLFQEDILVTDTDYGFLKYTDSDIEWLLILITYAVVDVIYNFCMEFLPLVHLLVVVPLISISLIIGFVPPMYAVWMGLAYFPVLFCTANCFNYGKKKSRKFLSDDYPYTGKVTVSAGITTVLLTTIVTCAVTLWLLAGGYERPEWMQDWKDTVNTAMEENNVKDGIKVLSELFGGEDELTSGKRGSLNDTKVVQYTGKKVMKIKISGNPGSSFYLKSFAGTDYEGDAWAPRSASELSEEEKYLIDLVNEYDYTETDKSWRTIYRYSQTIFRESLSCKLASYQFDRKYLFTLQQVTSYTMEVQNLLKNDTNVYKPYFSQTNSTDDTICGGDGYEYLTEGITGGTTSFYCYQVDDPSDITGVLSTYGEYPFVSENGESNENLQNFISMEKCYAQYVEQHYLDVPENLADTMSRFQKVTTIFRGNRITLEQGDGQYRELGYEPYIQYVRQYFEKNNYTYNINVKRNSDKTDFIEDFMKRKTGYCIHFASAAVMMFRSMGIPARYAEGYFVESSDLTSESYGTKEYTVTDESAHAWVEIYEEGIGWVPVEVTPGKANFVVTKESVTSEKQEGNTTQEMTTKAKKDKNEETTLTTAETTTSKAAEEETTTQAPETQEMNHPENQGVTRSVLLVFTVAVVVLLRYQILSSRNHTRLRDKGKKTRVREIERQMNQTNHIFKVTFSDYETNEEKAEKIQEKLQKSNITKQEILRTLEIFDKYHYAPVGSLEPEEVEEIYGFLTKYATVMYREGKTGEKFMYKYIKCLYLSDK